MSMLIEHVQVINVNDIRSGWEDKLTDRPITQLKQIAAVAPPLFPWLVTKMPITTNLT